MKKTASIILVGIIMIVGMIGILSQNSLGYVQALAQEGNGLEALVGLRVRIWHDIPKDTFLGSTSNNAQRIVGTFWQIKGDWLILRIWQEWGNGYIWCYIPQIRRIEILDKNYRPAIKMEKG